jgi:hypothetical protein
MENAHEKDFNLDRISEYHKMDENNFVKYSIYNAHSWASVLSLRLILKEINLRLIAAKKTF